jgi:glutathione S-transferase
MIDLYTRDYTAGTFVRCLLEEVGEPYRIISVTRTDGVIDPPEYAAINPQGTVPTIVDGDLVVSETLAILLHLADQHPGAELAPLPGTPGRPILYKWLGYLTNNPMAAFYRWYHADEMVADEAAVPGLKAGAFADLERCGTFLEAGLTSRPYLLGDQVTIADFFLTGLGAWADGVEGLTFGGEAVAAHRARIESRPSFQKVYAAEGMLQTA